MEGKHCYCVVTGMPIFRRRYFGVELGGLCSGQRQGLVWRLSELVPGSGALYACDSGTFTLGYRQNVPNPDACREGVAIQSKFKSLDWRLGIIGTCRCVRFPQLVQPSNAPLKTGKRYGSVSL